MPIQRTLLNSSTICSLCLKRLLKEQRHNVRHFASITASGSPRTLSFTKQYFWDNNVWITRDRSSRSQDEGTTDQMWPQATAKTHLLPQNKKEIAHSITVPHDNAPGTVLPHRRRKRWKSEAEVFGNATPERPLPLDASSQLSQLSAQSPTNTLRRKALAFLALSKPRLTFLIVLTTTTSYSLFPVAVSPMASSMDLSPLTLLTLTTGTALASASANAFNMLFEPAYDAQMTRTRTRPLVRGLLSSKAALAFAAGTGLTGVALLNYGVNPTTALLGAANILIYAGIYTPMKRISIWNTWVGAIVGGIPPLMGWAAAAGQATPYVDATWRELLLSPDGSSAGGWLLATLLFAWQFPHFWALAYPIRSEYAAAGYKMLVSHNVRKTARIALRYSVLMFPICAGLSYTGVTSWAFVPVSGIANAWLVRESWRYWKHEGAKGSARGLFWASVWHLPVVLVLAMVMKKGLWERFVQGGLDPEELRTWQEGDPGGQGLGERRVRANGS